MSNGFGETRADGGESTKNQAPSTKEAPNSKHQKTPSTGNFPGYRYRWTGNEGVFHRERAALSGTSEPVRLRWLIGRPGHRAYAEIRGPGASDGLPAAVEGTAETAVTLSLLVGRG